MVSDLDRIGIAEIKLAELGQRRDALQAEIEAVEQEISDLRGYLATAPKIEAEVAAHLATEPSAGAGHAPKPSSNKSLFEEICAVMAQTGKAMSSDEIANGLLKAGYRYQRRLPLSVTVRNELIRQRKKNGRVRRIGRGRYKMVDGG